MFIFYGIYSVSVSIWELSHLWELSSGDIVENCVLKEAAESFPLLWESNVYPIGLISIKTEEQHFV